MRPRFLLVAALASFGIPVVCQQPAVVQPGVPGQPTKVLTPSTTGLHLLPPTKADTEFMQGMIVHHSQAVEMVDLVRTHSKDPAVLEIGRRIGVSQTSEIVFMKKWLTDRGLPLEGDMSGMAGMNMSMPGMDMSHMDMSDVAPMPGMLTPRQMATLRAATGPKFDHLFLTGMIQHHTGALTMVHDLFQQPAAGQDPDLFDFSTDVDNTQQAEIDIMKRMLKEEK